MHNMAVTIQKNALRDQRGGEKATSSVAPAIATMYECLGDLPFKHEMRNKEDCPNTELKKQGSFFSNPNPNQSVFCELNT